MSRTKCYLLCLTFFHKKPREFRGGSQGRGSLGHSEAFHLLDPAVSYFDVEPKGGAVFVVGSLPFYLVPRALGLLKIGGRGASVKATLRSTLRSMCAWAHSLPAVRGPPRARPPQPLPDGRSGAPTPYDLDARDQQGFDEYANPKDLSP